MKVCVFIIFIVIQATACEKAIAKLQRKLMVPEMNDKCKKIKCANVEEPQCVQMRRHDLTSTIHVIAANKCELQYMKCHDDVEAKIVPMKYCSHNATLTAGKKKTEAGKTHIRVKRKTKSYKLRIARTNVTKPDEMGKTHESTEAYMIPLKKKKKATTPEVEPRVSGKNRNRNRHRNRNRNRKRKPSKSKKQRVKNGKLPLLFKSRYGHAGKKMKMLSKGNKLRKNNASNAKDRHFFYTASTESETDEFNERIRLYNGIGGHVVNYGILKPSSLQEKSLKQVTPADLTDPGGPAYYDDTEDDEREYSQEPLNKKLPESEESADFPMFSEESANFSAAMPKVDMAEYGEDCPTVCPARDVMVCGKCQHGIYKTFNSVCHMRMFSCKHDNEELELISRKPCVFSAPYLSGPKMMPVGRYTELNDDDQILRYIRCRDRRLLDKKKDNRCKFPKAKEHLKFFDFKGVQINMIHSLANTDDDSQQEDSES